MQEKKPEMLISKFDNVDKCIDNVNTELINADISINLQELYESFLEGYKVYSKVSKEIKGGIREIWAERDALASEKIKLESAVAKHIGRIYELEEQLQEKEDDLHEYEIKINDLENAGLAGHYDKLKFVNKILIPMSNHEFTEQIYEPFKLYEIPNE